MLTPLAPLTPEYIRLLLTDRLQMEPPARKAAVVTSFVQVAKLCGDRVGRDSLRLAMSDLATARDGDAPPVAARRTTCAAVAEALAFRPGELDAAMQAAPYSPGGINAGGYREAGFWFGAQVDAWTDSTDPRLVAMAATAKRELSEIEAVSG